jgi:ABC-type transport system substrate-binding protein
MTPVLLAFAGIPEQPAHWPADLEQAAAKAPPEIADLYRSLAAPFDEITLTDGSRQRVPLPARPGAGKLPHHNAKVAITPYEEMALAKVNDFLSGKGPPDMEKVQAAEQILTVVLRFHMAVRERPLGGADPWKGLEARLARKLRDIRLMGLERLAAGARQANEWARALARAGELAELYPESERVKLETATVWARYAEDRLKGEDYPAARAYVERIDRVFLDNQKAGDLRRALQERAEALVKEAGSLDDKAAVARLAEALQVWPRLPGLRDALLKRQGAYPVLYVGVASLPERLSPATGWTDPEKQAVELLFERLVAEVYGEAHGERYQPRLAAALPEPLPGGRRCRLRPDAYWSDGGRVTSADVRHSALLLGRSPAWADLVEPPSIESDPFRIDFRFRKDFLDPLAPLSFHIVPQSLAQAGDPAFAKAPLGSGPFKYAGHQGQAGRDYAVFVANPHYGLRERKGAIPEGRPFIREIRFFVSKDPARDFQDPARPLHLLLDLPTERIKALKQAGVGDIRTLENRRVYILAVNHRVSALKSQALRRALAHGLDRDSILTSCFRGGHPAQRVAGVLGAVAAAALAPLHTSHPEFHRPANGPYPPKSWACAPGTRVPMKLFDPERARALLVQAKEKEGLAKVGLTLKYPRDDPRAELACREIARQLAALGSSAQLPLKIQPVPALPHELRTALSGGHYDLAYHHLDYANEAYWLWPLFDDRPEALQPGGSNYLGYQDDARLVSLFRRALGTRDFAKVREITHDIHDHLSERMPLIPLWQLDTHLAIHPDLAPTPLDPLRIFGDVAEWRLKAR